MYDLHNCLDCGVKVTKENDSGWKVMGYALCNDCDRARGYTEKGEDCLKHFQKCLTR